ncbi:hypothetical protein C8R46DRAFT_1236435 [Mycena filopes]|nr:hypothetical protein C8R46DRAFT_1236435 [Mycena filopes]
MSNIPMFSGNRTIDSIGPQDWLQQIRVLYRQQKYAEAVKLADVADRFAYGSPAHKWFAALDPTTERATWDQFETNFKARFPEVVVAEKPRLLRLAQIAGMRISLDELAVGTIQVRNAPVPALAEFAMRVNDCVTEVGASGEQDAGLYVFHAALPTSIRGAVGGVPATWGDMVNALLAVPQQVVDAALEAHRATTTMQNKIDALAEAFEKTRVEQRNAGGGGAARGGAPVVAGRGGAQAGGGGRGGAPVGRGGAQAGGGARRGRPPPTDAEKAALRRVLQEVIARRAPDTPEGRAMYTTQIGLWNAKNGHILPDDVAIEVTGYPLSPGSPPPLSGECWRCGSAAAHNRSNCPRPPLPDLESRFRVVCGSWLGAAAPQVNEVAEVGVPWYEEEAQGGHF